MAVRFRDRSEAGALLAARLRERVRPPAVVLALPRGGVPVGLEIARALGCPLDLVMVRKVGAPDQPELALGAVANGERPERVVNAEVMRLTGAGEDYFARASARELEEIARRRARYLAGRRPAPVQGRTAIVVDDGIATGASMRAALRAVRRKRPERVVLAVPVAPPDTLARLREEADEVVCLITPSWFSAVGQFYEDFSQTSDEDVVAALRAAPPSEEESE